MAPMQYPLLPHRLPPIAALLCAVVAAGCGARSSVLGVDGTGAAGGGGAGGATSSGGAGTSTTVTGGTTGVGGTAGAGGVGGDVQSLVEACAFIASCPTAGPSWSLFSPSTCVDSLARLGWWYESPGAMPDPTFTARLLDCAAESPGDCAALAACWGHSDWFGFSRCREGGSCPDGSSVMLGGPAGASLDCAELGGTCVNLWSNAQRACCNAQPCDGVTGVQCDGTKVSLCGGWGERIDFDCGVSGRTCNDDPLAPCKGSSPCDPATSLTECMGSTAIYCSGGGQAVYECANTLFRTACNEGGPSYEVPCRPKGAACDPTYEAGTCNGEALRVCVDGEWVDVDCAKIGFKTCTQGMDMARCTK